MKRHNFLLFFVVTLYISSANAQWTDKISGTTNQLYDVHFPDQTTGYVVGYAGTVLKTIDTGETWTALTTGSSINFEAVFFLTEDKGFAIGEDVLLSTEDGGVIWTEIALPVSTLLYDVEFLDAQVGFCVGSGGTILKTTDGGVNWTVKPSGVSRNLCNIQFPTANVGYAVSTGYNWNFLKTTDGGETWVDNAIAPIDNLSSLEAVYFTDENSGVIGGWYLSALVKTNDGGVTWDNVDPTGTGAQMYSIHFPTDLVGYGVGWYGEIYSTGDGGSTWTVETLADNTRLTSVFFVNTTTGIAVGDGGKILKTSNGTADLTDKNTPINFLISPNPVQESLLVKFDDLNVDLETIRVVNIVGEVLIEAAVSADYHTIDFSSFDAGTYFVTLSSASTTSTKKVVKN
jgi:photosystem II stability/assembly factor-like uncharacterized protein